MKRILITGVNSYIGSSLVNWLSKHSEEYSITTLSLRDNNWINEDFSTFDTIIHVAGIAHVSSSQNNEKLYYSINRDLTIKIARKAKDDDVKQFIFMSSIIVYGNNVKDGIIDTYTVPQPINAYGKSKLEAEFALNELKSNSFKVAILRPPMIYGKNSKGNYPKLSAIARKSPVFPQFTNYRSMLHIDNLCELIKMIIDQVDEGLFHPQNKDYICTSELVTIIAKVHGRKIRLIPVFPGIIRMLQRLNIVNKVFGNLVYDKSMSVYPKGDYQIREFIESIELTEM